MQDQNKKGPQDAFVSKPSAEAFERKHVTTGAMLHEGQRFPMLDHVEYPPEGGIYTYYRTFPYPAKGFPFPEACWMNDIAKRITQTFVRLVGNKNMLLPIVAFLILPWGRKMKIVETFLSAYTRMNEWVLSSFYLKEERYCISVRELRKAVDGFLKALKIPDKIGGHPQDVPKIVATIFEYDDAYRYRFQDIMGETSATALIERPRREVARLFEIFMQREEDPRVKASFKVFAKVASVALLHPKIRRAFRAAINAANVSKMKLDNADRYHVLNRGGYDFTGRNIQQRQQILVDFHRERNIPFPTYATVAPDAEQAPEHLQTR